MSTANRAGQSARAFEAAQWRQLALITLGAVAIFFGLRLLPTGTELSHMDFRVDPKAGTSIEFCDPLNPQFIPVIAVRSPVSMTIATVTPAAQGQEVRATVSLKTSSGKAIAPEDLLYTHTRRLHLLVVDPTLSDYQHVHPEPAKTPGEWTFSFTPLRAGVYRVFGDFTPAATNRGLYASVDLPVAPDGAAASSAPEVLSPGASRVERDALRFTLTTAQRPVRAAQPIDLRFTVERTDGAVLELTPVMDALAHLVAFDLERSGFAHLHPAGVEASAQAGNRRELAFKLTIPRPGRYVIWAQLSPAGREMFVPFTIDVVP